MTDEQKRISGRYMICGRPGWCIQKDQTIHVEFDDGSFTCANVKTFSRWGAVPEKSAKSVNQQPTEEK